MAKHRFVLAPEFRRDIYDVLRWSARHFGLDASDRYGTLIRQAVQDLRADPLRPGTKRQVSLFDGAYTYHLLHSRDRVSGDTVKRPRHFVFYKSAEGKTTLARLLHDNRDLQRHVPALLQPPK